MNDHEMVSPGAWARGRGWASVVVVLMGLVATSPLWLAFLVGAMK